MIKMLISHRCIHDLMPNLIKKSWTVSILYLATKFYIRNIHHKGGCSISVEARWQKTHYKPTPVKIWNEIIISTPQWPCLAWLQHCVLKYVLRGHFFENQVWSHLYHISIVLAMDYGHRKATSLNLCKPNLNPYLK